MVGVNVPIEPGYRGSITGVTHAGRAQRATLKVQTASSREVTLGRFEGQGENVPMTSDKSSKSLSFGPFNERAVINVVIENKTVAGEYVLSKQVQPVTIKREPDVIHKEGYIVSTLLSEDEKDDDYDDCIISVLQHK